MAMYAEWKDDWIRHIKLVLAAGCSMGEATAAINHKFKLEFTRSAVIAKIMRLKKNNEFGRPSKMEVWHGRSIENLVTYWQNGIPTDEIARFYGVEDSTIRNKAKEYGLRPKPINKPKKKITVEPVAVPETNKVAIDWTTGRETFPNPEAKRLLFEELTSKSCRFVIGEKPYYFCGADINEESRYPYCAICHKVVYVPPRYWGG